MTDTLSPHAEPDTTVGPSEDAALLRSAALPLTGDADIAPLLKRIGDSRYVLIGEASHGTHDFYEWRAQITRRLIRDKGFNIVAVEGDWPDCYRINRYVRGAEDIPGAEAALAAFTRFPRWMWRNTVVLDFVEWLRRHNGGHPPMARVGFYGLDLYSLYASMQEVIDYLERRDPAAAAQARERFACFEHYGGDAQSYGLAASFGGASCENAVVEQLAALRRNAPRYLGTDVILPEDAQFCAEQNARVVRNAEEYYRSMFRGRASSWNLRDNHMMETLEALMCRPGAGPAKVVVWAHNSHLGDARATEMTVRGEHNLGELVRRRRADAYNIGFSTYRGTVTAADDWDAPARCKIVRDGLAGSYEALFHSAGLPAFMIFPGKRGLGSVLGKPRLQRAIGVIYRPQTERASHYFNAVLPAQFDAMLHIDTTHALTPLDKHEAWTAGAEAPETFPSAL